MLLLLPSRKFKKFLQKKMLFIDAIGLDLLCFLWSSRNRNRSCGSLLLKLKEGSERDSSSSCLSSLGGWGILV